MVGRTGAGDSYTLGLIYGLWSGHHFSHAMRIGTANAWSVVQKIGPQGGLLHKSQLAGVLKKFTKIKLKRELNHTD